MFRWSFPRRQQYRRLRRAALSGAAGVTTGLLAVIAGSTGAIPVASVLVLIMVVLMIDARRWARLAGRSRVGARSEEEVQRALAALEAEGWRLRHSLPWRAVATSTAWRSRPTGVAFAIETKCAARRPVVSPAQPGGTRREVLGSNGLPGSER